MAFRFRRAVLDFCGDVSHRVSHENGDDQADAARPWNRAHVGCGGRGGHRRVNLVSLRSLATDEGGLAVQELAKRVGVIEDAGRIQRARIDALEKEVRSLKVQANP